MSGQENTLRTEIERHGARIYFDNGMRKEKPYYRLRILDAAGEVLFEDPWCADNVAFCGAKGDRLIAYYQEHGEFPDGEPIAKPFIFKEQ